MLALAWLSCVARGAHAQTSDEAARVPRDGVDRPASRGDPREHGLGVTVAARTDVPLFAGGQGWLEHGPTRLRVGATVGVLPAGYGRMVNSTLTRAGAYDDRLGRALDATLADGFAWGLRAGFRPFPRHGLLLEAGWGITALVAQGDARDLVSREIGATVPSVAGVDTTFSFRSTLQLVDGRVGWEWLVFDHVSVAANVGVARVVSSSTSLDQRYLGRAPQLAQNAVAQGLGTLDQAFVRYGWVPTAGLSAGWRF